MPVEITDEPGLPVRPSTMAKLERAYNRVMREHIRNGPAQPQDYGLQWVLKGKLDGDLTALGSQTLSLWEPNSSDVEADTGNNITVWDWLLDGGKKLSSGAQCFVVHVGKRWYVIASESCPVDA